MCTKNLPNLSHPLLNNNNIFKIYNVGKESFIYAVLSALYSNRLHRNVAHNIRPYKIFKKKLNLANINFPCKTLDIKRFIKQNKNLNLCIYLFEARRNCNGSLQIFSDQKIGNGKQRIHLLSYTLYSNKKVKNKYYFWMKNINNTFRQENEGATAR